MSDKYLMNKLLPALSKYLDNDKCNVDDFIFNGDHTEDTNNTNDKCICGVNIKYKYSIKHVPTDDIIYPIGSECINHFKNMKEYIKFKRFKHLANLKVRGGKYKGMLISKLYPSILNRFYTMNNYNNKVYIEEIKEYYKLKNIDKIEKYFKKLP